MYHSAKRKIHCDHLIYVNKYSMYQLCSRHWGNICEKTDMILGTSLAVQWLGL